MRGRLLLLIGVLALVASASVSAASLDVIRGTRGPDTLNGTAGGDLIYARAGNDAVRGHDGGDVIYGGDGNAVVRGGPGNDVLHALANDNTRDVMDCGPGLDVAYVIQHDPVTLRGCEQVIRLSTEQAAALAAANDDNG